MLDGQLIILRMRHRETGRVLTKQGKQFNRLHDWAKEYSKKKFDVYYGCAARDQDGQFISSSILWVDLDKPMALALRMPPPSYVVASGRGQHLYWMLDSPVTNKEVLREHLRNTAQLLDGDTACAEPMHFLRVPGTLNHKYEPPLPVTLIVDSGYVYSLNDIVKFQLLPDDVIGALYTKKPQGERSEHDWRIINQLITFGISQQTIETIFMALPIGEKARENPNYLTTTIMNAYAKLGGTPTPTPSVSSAVAGDIMPQQGRPVGEIIKLDDRYVRIQKDQITDLSTFVFDIVAVQESVDGDTFIVNARRDGHVVLANFALPTKVLTKSDALSMHLPSAGIVWYGTDGLTRKLRAFLFEEWRELGYPLIHVATQLGRHIQAEHDVYVTSRGVFNTDLSESTDIVYVEPGHEHPTIEHDFAREPLSPRELKNVFESIRDTNEPQVMAPLLGWFAACNFKPLLEDLGIRFPHLLVYGTRGAGKTTVITKVFQPLSGYSTPLTWQANSTPFVLMTLLGSTTTVPVCLTEFRESSQRSKSRFFSLLRSAYDFGLEARGRPDLTTQTYNLSTPMCIDGEDNISDPALQERIISVYLDVRDISSHRGALLSLDDQELRRAGTAIVIEALKMDSAEVFELFNRAYAIMQQTYGRDIPERILNNQAIVLMGLMFIEEKLGVHVFHVSADAVKTYFESEMAELVNVKVGRTSLGVDSLVESVMNHIVTAKVEGTRSEVIYRYMPERDGPAAAFHLPTAYDWWAKQQMHLRRDVPTKSMIEKQLVEQMGGYIIEAKQAMTNFNRSLRLYFVDLRAAVDAGLDIDIP